jgi:hypothetical protein
LGFEHVVVGALGHDTDARGRDAAQRRVQRSVFGSVGKDACRERKTASINKSAGAPDQRAFLDELPVRNHGVGKRDERIEHDRHSPDAGEHADHEHVEPTRIQDEHDIAARTA